MNAKLYAECNTNTYTHTQKRTLKARLFAAVAMNWNLYVNMHADKYLGNIAMNACIGCSFFSGIEYSRGIVVKTDIYVPHTLINWHQRA